MRSMPAGRGPWMARVSSNQRHADFQHNGEPRSARASRRNPRSFRESDRTAVPDRAYSGYPKKHACASSATNDAKSSMEFASGLGS